MNKMSKNCISWLMTDEEEEEEEEEVDESDKHI